MSNAQRQATKRFRARRSSQGLRRIEVHVPAAEAAVIRKAATVLRGDTKEAAQLRRHLGFDPKSVQSAAEIFAMNGPLSAEAEALWDKAMTRIGRDRRNAALNRMRKLDL